MDNAALTTARRTRPLYRVFVSSTWTDLQPERKALMEALNRMEEMRFVGMEFFGNRPDDTHDASIDQVDLCEVLVGIIGYRYGSGITEAEYRRARKLGLPCFVYFKRADLSRPDQSDGDPALAAKLAAFKQDLLLGHTVKEFTSPEELAANATADLHNWVAARWISLERETPAPAPAPVAPPDADRTNILRLLERIQHDWVEGVLEASLHCKAWMDLGLDWKDEAVQQPWDRILVAPDRPVKTLGDRETIAGVFTAAQNTLLILGEPGAGKTTTLLELARDLVRRARESANAAPAVVLALSTWTGRHRTLAEWVAEEMNLRYQVPKRLAAAWLEGGRLVLLLDGLDEVREELRAACVAAINGFAQDNMPAGLAVTCRVMEYSALKEKLRLRSAICLQPLTPAQIDSYFERAGAGMENLRAAMREDEALRALAQTPLLLSVMTMAWRDASAESWQAGDTATVEQRRTQLFEAYVQTALRRKGTKEGDGQGKELLRVLPWLARQMRTRGQTLFALEELQPTWLDGAGHQLAYFAVARTLAVLVLGLPFLLFPVLAVPKMTVLAMGLLLGAAFTSVDFFLFRWKGSYTPVHRAVLLSFAFVACPALVASVTEAFRSTRSPSLDAGPLMAYAFLVVATSSTLADIRSRDIRAGDSMGWSWRQGLRRGANAVVFWKLFLLFGFIEFAFWGWHQALVEFGINGRGLLIGMSVGALFAGWLVRHGWRGWVAAARCVTLVLICGEIGMACYTHLKSGAPNIVGNLVIGGLVALFGGFTASIDATRARRSGAWFWVKVPFLAALVVSSVIAGGLFGSSLSLSGSLSDWRTLTAIAGAVGGIFGLIAFFRFGGFQGMQHYILRQLLVRSGRLPSNPTALLDYAARLNLLQKVGFGYRFIHALLLDHLATRDQKAAKKTIPSPG